MFKIGCLDGANLKDRVLSIVDALTHTWFPDIHAFPWGPHDQVPIPTERTSAEDPVNVFDRAGGCQWNLPAASSLRLRPRPSH